MRLTNDADDLALLEAAKHGYSKGGVRGATKAKIQVEEEQARRVYIDPGWIAGDYAFLGEKDKAFDWLDRAAAEKSGSTLIIKSSPFASLRGDPRYKTLLKKMGLEP